jgi:hypothetical protein
MSSSFISASGSHVVSNRRFDSLLEWAAIVCLEIARSNSEQGFATQLRDAHQQMHPGYDLDWEEDFPDLAARTFYARAFAEVAQRITSGSIGHPGTPAQQREASSDAAAVAKLLS